MRRMASFDEVTALRGGDDGVFHAELTQDWAQGRASFGGVVSALGLRASARTAGEGRALRSVMVDFAAAVAPGPVDVRVEVLRAGKALTHLSSRIEQNGQCCAVVTAAWGGARKSAISVDGERAPQVMKPDAITPFPYIEGVTPVFTQHFDYRWTGPGIPFTGQQKAELGGWVRHKEPAVLDGAGVLALIDAWPAPVLPLLEKPAPASSVTWMVNLAALPEAGTFSPDAWWLFDAVATGARDGYADVSGRLWSPAGELVATSRQLVAEFS